MNAKPQLSDELKRIPTAAKVIAALVPVCVIAGAVIVAFLRVTATRTPAGVRGGGGPGIAALLFLVVPVIASVLLTIWVLLVGYVYADAGRRGMNRLLWMLVVIFVPNALGFILYFLLRHPVSAECPGCHSLLTTDAGYCPQCGTQLARSCPKCSRLVGLTDRFCPACGQNLQAAAEQPG